MIVPDAHLRILDFHYQMMLYELFHQARFTRTVHVLITPIALFGMFAMAASVTFLSVAMLVGIFIWYVMLDVRVGIAATPVLIAAWFAGEWFHVLYPDTAGWWGTAVAFGCALFETLSHSVEPFPPPWTGNEHFLPKGVQADVPLPIMVMALVMGVTIFPVLELMSSSRIFAVLVAGALARFGYRRDEYQDARAVALQILAGKRVLSEHFGGTPASVPSPSLSPAS